MAVLNYQRVPHKARFLPWETRCSNMRGRVGKVAEAAAGVASVLWWASAASGWKLETVSTMWGPPVISLFINPINYSYKNVISTKNHSEIGVANQLSYLGGPHIVHVSTIWLKFIPPQFCWVWKKCHVVHWNNPPLMWYHMMCYCSILFWYVSLFILLYFIAFYFVCWVFWFWVEWFYNIWF